MHLARMGLLSSKWDALKFFSPTSRFRAVLVAVVLLQYRESQMVMPLHANLRPGCKVPAAVDVAHKRLVLPSAGFRLGRDGQRPRAEHTDVSSSL